MSESTALPPDPLSGSTLAAYWSYGYDMPDDLGGGFVTGELLLRADGVLLRRQTLYFPTEGGKLSPGFGPWDRSPGGKARPTPSGLPGCCTTAVTTSTSSIQRA